ncbi:uncharacterized protein LOC113203052 [Frankliniella occidentalis]|uniref:Uncharacterized protein LOC113203052 n=1 Tax=Frankliniella occidentalis TaxID=133901 RepID=A0A6J1RYA7_FRAOC|nr:uncharacterized protein LOC113203052 [Frankliniella occidentalis]
MPPPPPRPTRSQPPRASKTRSWVVRNRPPQKSTTAAEATATEAVAENVQVGLLELPDVALLRVLSYLDVNDLMALGLAIPTLAAFSRASTALWCRGPWTIGATFRDVRGLIFLLRVAPPVDRLTVQTRYFHPDEDEGDSFRFESSRNGVKVVCDTSTDTPEVVVQVLRETSASLRHLDVIGGTPLDVVLGSSVGSLQDARCLETLRVQDWTLLEEASFTWPQASVLPRLHTVIVEARSVDFGMPQTLAVGLEALRSLLQAHSGQLRCVEVNAPKLVPLIDACSPGALHRLSVPPAKGVTALIRRMAGEELKINQRRLEDEDGVEEVDDFLRSWSTPCALLELHLFRPETFAALGVGGLGRLQHLVLDEPRDFMRQLDLVLAGLPHLRSLTTMMRAVFAPDLFDLPAASIPALEQLLIKGDGYCKAPTPCHCKECVRVDQLGPVLQALVRRAPAPLHAAFLWTRKYGEDGDDEPREGVVPWGGREPGYPVFHRHARKEGGEKEEDCALCDQAVASVHARSHDGVLLRHVCCK